MKKDPQFKNHVFLCSMMLRVKIFKNTNLVILGSCLLLFVIYAFLFEILIVNSQPRENMVYNNFFVLTDYSFRMEKSQNYSQQQVLTSRSFLRLNQNKILNRIGPNVVFFKASNFSYGHRVLSMLTAFMVAALTDSPLLINWPLINYHIDCVLPYTFYTFKDKSFLDYEQKTSQICHFISPSKNSSIQTDESMQIFVIY